MTLEKYISEAISHGWHKSQDNDMYADFPQKRTDKEGITNWLIQNGFVAVQFNSTYIGDDLIKHYKAKGEKGFYVGMDAFFGTDYIVFYDGYVMFCVYTCPLSDPKHNLSATEPVSFLKNPVVGACQFEKFKYCSLKGIQRYFKNKYI